MTPVPMRVASSETLPSTRKVLRLRKAEHTAPVGWLNVIGNAGEPRDLVRAAAVVTPHGPMPGVASVAADVTKMDLPWAQAQPMRLALWRQPAAGGPRLNFFTRRGSWHGADGLPIFDQYIMLACTNEH